MVLPLWSEPKTIDLAKGRVRDGCHLTVPFIPAWRARTGRRTGARPFACVHSARRKHTPCVGSVVGGVEQVLTRGFRILDTDCARRLRRPVLDVLGPWVAPVPTRLFVETCGFACLCLADRATQPPAWDTSAAACSATQTATAQNAQHSTAPPAVPRRAPPPQAHSLLSGY